VVTAEEHTLADGRVIGLRPAGPADVAAVTQLYLGLSPASFGHRFHAGRPSPEVVGRLAALEPGTFGLIAVPYGGGDGLAGEARYVPAGDGSAELALAVRDSWQGAGLGHRLLDGLVRRAHQDGLARLRAIVLLGNLPMLRLLERYGWVVAAPTEEFAVATLEIATDGGMPGWPPGSEGRRVLVERRGWFDDARTAGLRAAGQHIRHCAGPLRTAGRPCPLLASGTCRLAEEADQILSLLPAGDPDCAAVAAEHRRRWAAKLAR
jgi:GNAT superfamily N-acetyltransferase